MIIIVKGRCFGDDFSTDNEPHYIENIVNVEHEFYGVRISFEGKEDVTIDRCDNRTISIVDNCG